MPREVLLLEEMIDAAEQAMLLAGNQNADTLQHDRLRRDALLWNFMVLGEAAAQLPASFKAEHDAVNWGRPTQLRNRIVHGYWSADLEILVDTAHLDLPAYAAQLRSVLGALETRKP